MSCKKWDKLWSNCDGRESEKRKRIKKLPAWFGVFKTFIPLACWGIREDRELPPEQNSRHVSKHSPSKRKNSSLASGYLWSFSLFSCWQRQTSHIIQLFFSLLSDRFQIMCRSFWTFLSKTHFKIIKSMKKRKKKNCFDMLERLSTLRSITERRVNCVY